MILRPTVVKQINWLCYIVNNSCLKFLFSKLWFVDIIIKNLHINAATNLYILLYICLVLSGCVKHSSKLPCEKTLFWAKTSTRKLHRTMSTWGQSEKSIAAWIHFISTKRIQDPGRTPFLTLYHTYNLEASTLPTKNSCTSQNCTQFNSLPPDLLHNISMFHAGLVHHNKLKPVILWITQQNPVSLVPKSYKLKYVPFYYFMYYNIIKYAWKDRILGPHKFNRDHKGVKEQIIKHETI